MPTITIILIITSVHLKYTWKVFTTETPSSSLLEVSKTIVSSSDPHCNYFFPLYYKTNYIYCIVGYTSIVLTTRHSINLQYWGSLRIYLASPSEVPLFSLNWPKRTPHLFADSLERCHDIKTVLVKSNTEKLLTGYTDLCQLQNGVNMGRYPLSLSCSVQAYFSPHSWLPLKWSLKENIWFCLYS